jgi:hypothetical protein
MREVGLKKVLLYVPVGSKIISDIELYVWNTTYGAYINAVPVASVSRYTLVHPRAVKVI